MNHELGLLMVGGFRPKALLALSGEEKCSLSGPLWQRSVAVLSDRRRPRKPENLQYAVETSRSVPE